MVECFSDIAASDSVWDAPRRVWDVWTGCRRHELPRLLLEQLVWSPLWLPVVLLL